MPQVTEAKYARVEILECRIAPALFFVSAGSLNIVDKTGATHMATSAESAAEAATGATVALALKAGDSLVFDANSNHVFDTGDTVLLAVTGGKAIGISHELRRREWWRLGYRLHER